MAKVFKFRLEPVLRFRERIEDSMRARFVEIQQIRNQKLAEIEKLHEDLHQARESMAESKAGLLDISRLKLMNRYLTGLMVSERQKKGELRVIDQEVDKRRDEFVAARKQVRVMEKLRDRKREEHDYEEGVEQTKLFDEMAVQKMVKARRDGDRLATLRAVAQLRDAGLLGNDGSDMSDND